MKIYNKPKPKIFLLASVFILLTSIITPQLAYGYDLFYSTNDILFYDPEEAAIDCSGTIVLSGDDNRQKIFNFLISKGLTNEQAAGVLGNIQQESGFSPTRQSESAKFGSGAWGLAQWLSGRKSSLLKHLKENYPELHSKYYTAEWGDGVDSNNGYVPISLITKESMLIEDNDSLLIAELDFLYDESQSRKIPSIAAEYSSASTSETEWKAISKATSTRDASTIWLLAFERPVGEKDGKEAIQRMVNTRAEASEKILAELQNESSGSVPASSSACIDPSSGSIEALKATVKSYAWPNYEGRGYTVKTEAYAAAITKALSEGRYVGSNGIDCGGFVTTAIYDSSYDRKYNYNAKGGNTSSQKDWLDANWEKLDIKDTADLRPGDVSITLYSDRDGGHTFLFIGTDLEGFGSEMNGGWKGVVSSAHNSRAPMAGVEDLLDPDYTWYRKK